MLEVILPSVISGTISSMLFRTKPACTFVTLSAETNDAVLLLNSQTIFGVGAPVEVQEMVTELPSTTPTKELPLTEVLASTGNKK